MQTLPLGGAQHHDDVRGNFSAVCSAGNGADWCVSVAELRKGDAKVEKQTEKSKARKLGANFERTGYPPLV